MDVSKQLPVLPVPELSKTLDGYLSAVRPLQDDAAHEATQRAVAEFAETDGPALHQALLDYANVQNAAGKSWLSDAWFESYNTERRPLPLASSVAKTMLTDDVPDLAAVGTARAADLIHRLAQMHLAYLHDELPAEVGAHGEPIDDSQLIVLEGGARLPRRFKDKFMGGSPEPANREMGVLWNGRLFYVRISDDRGRALPRNVIHAVLDQITAKCVQTGMSPLALSYLGSTYLAEELTFFLDDPENKKTHDRATGALFLVNLVDREGVEWPEELQRLNFGLDQAWVYKPMTYHFNLADGFTAVHQEHSMVDGGTFRHAWRQAKKMTPYDDETVAIPEVCEGVWNVEDADFAHELAVRLNQYRQHAEHFRARDIAIPVPAAPAYRLSSDACQQIVLAYAQLRTYGRLRSHYEAVDMRAYQAGRTECLRPVTMEMRDLVEAMQTGTATPGQLHATLDAHRTLVKQAHSGQGFSRHLFMLKTLATRAGLSPAIFTDPGYELLTTDFLSTTSLGDQPDIGVVSFAPTSHGGLGVYYVAPRDAEGNGRFEFLLMWRDDEAELVDEFAAALEEGTGKLWELIAQSEPEASNAPLKVGV